MSGILAVNILDVCVTRGSRAFRIFNTELQYELPGIQNKQIKGINFAGLLYPHTNITRMNEHNDCKGEAFC